MKTILLFFLTLIPLGIIAQWTSFSSGNFYDLSILKANGQKAIYKSVPCEIQLISLKNKKLKLTSTNSTIEQNNNGKTFIITSNESSALVQIFEEKKTKRILLAEVNIPTVETPKPDDFWLTIENQIILNSTNWNLNENDSESYDNQIILHPFTINFWTLSVKGLKNSFYGNGDHLSSEFLEYSRYLPEGTEYTISIDCKSEFGSSYLSKSFIIKDKELPSAKYVILNNTIQSKSFFDNNNQSSFIGLLNNNFKIQADLSKGIFNNTKSTSRDGEFIGPVKTGLDWETLKAYEIEFKKNPKSLKFSVFCDPIMHEKVVFANGNVVPVYYKSGTLTEVKYYYQGDKMIETLDTLTETLDPNQAELIPGTSVPYTVAFRKMKIEFAYTTDSIEKIIIRYDSIVNMNTGKIEVKPSRISLARKFGKNQLPEIVFSINIKDLLSFESYGPTIHIKNDKMNSSYFDIENSNSLLGFLNSKEIRDKEISDFPMINSTQKNAGEFGDDCDPNGKLDEKLIEWEEKIETYKLEKMIMVEGNAFQVFVKKGKSTEIKLYENNDPSIEILDGLTETTDPNEAELIPGTSDPLPVLYQIKQVTKKQFKGITDLFIKQKYILDPILNSYVCLPSTIGFAQQFPNQSKPTLILQVDLSENPEVAKLISIGQAQFYSDQSWFRAIIFDEVAKMGETIIASDIQSLQNKIQFRKKLVSIDGKKELVNTPHF